MNQTYGISAGLGRTTLTLVLRDLHQALFACTANLIGLASTFLHSDSGKENGVN